MWYALVLDHHYHYILIKFMESWIWWAENGHRKLFPSNSNDLNRRLPASQVLLILAKFFHETHISRIFSICPYFWYHEHNWMRSRSGEARNNTKKFVQTLILALFTSAFICALSLYIALLVASAALVIFRYTRNPLFKWYMHMQWFCCLQLCMQLDDDAKG